MKDPPPPSPKSERKKPSKRNVGIDSLPMGRIPPPAVSNTTVFQVPAVDVKVSCLKRYHKVQGFSM